MGELMMNNDTTNNGYHNTGSHNNGYHNTGSHNNGHHNNGHHNNGHYNNGSRNIGNRNNGYGNIGYHNNGNRNIGNWNNASNHVGCFNTLGAEYAYYFDELAKISDWDAAQKPEWIYQPSPTTWVIGVDMTDAEKQENPTYQTAGGFLRVNDMKEEWRKAYEIATEAEIQMVRDLPNFNAEKFEMITGLDLSVDAQGGCDGEIVEIRGRKYTLKEVK